MRNAEQYPFIPIESILGEAWFQSQLPLTLRHNDQSVVVVRLKVCAIFVRQLAKSQESGGMKL